MSDWIRVSAKSPCKVCGKPDWCTESATTGNVCCMRVESGSAISNGGWLHLQDGAKPNYVNRHKSAPEPPTINAEAIMRRWFERTYPSQYDALAEQLGVAVEALSLLKCGWSSENNAWAFPMRNATGLVCGIRLRANDGKKWSVKGGREGVFTGKQTPVLRAYICEGPTDAAAILSLGLFPIGRPSCNGALSVVQETLKRLRCREAVIVADADPDKFRNGGGYFNPGFDGAEALSKAIHVPNCIFTPPTKDVREFVNWGGTRAMIEAATRSMIWTQPKTQSYNQPSTCDMAVLLD